MRGLALLCLFAAAPLGADVGPLLGAGGSPPWSIPALPSAPSAFPDLRTPAFLDGVAPPSLDPTTLLPGLSTPFHIPGIPRDGSVTVGVDDRYDWLPTYGTNADHDRPWLRAGSEWTIPGPGMKVFLGVGAAVPLASSTNGMPAQDPAVRAAATRGQVGVFFGVRF